MAVLDTMPIFSYIWKKLAGIHLTIVLCLLLAADLSFGYVCLNRNEILFAPLNDVGLIAWINTYGRCNLKSTAWLLALLVLLTLFCINTFVCTTDRVARLIRHRRKYPRLRLLFRLAPHLMHYALILILTGYLCSYTFARVLDSRTLVPGSSLTLPGTEARIQFQSFSPDYYKGSRMPAFDQHVIRPRARLLLIDGDHRRKAELSYNKPVIFKNYGIFLKDFAPKKKGGGMNSNERIDLTIRKDPGVFLYMLGMLLFTAGIALYLTDWMAPKNGKRRPDE
ncbi:MAG: hypothetical protein R6V39_07815 [Desulfovibrionales bacterium]